MCFANHFSAGPLYLASSGVASHLRFISLPPFLWAFFARLFHVSFNIRLLFHYMFCHGGRDFVPRLGREFLITFGASQGNKQVASRW